MPRERSVRLRSVIFSMTHGERTFGQFKGQPLGTSPPAIQSIDNQGRESGWRTRCTLTQNCTGSYCGLV